MAEGARLLSISSFAIIRLTGKSYVKLYLFSRWSNFDAVFTNLLGVIRNFDDPLSVTREKASKNKEDDLIEVNDVSLKPVHRHREDGRIQEFPS